jgi:shikimate dehydrogenase
MKRVFLLGYSITHSLSPPMHNAAFRVLNLDWQYELLETPRERLCEAVAQLRSDDCAGANVTVPHKQAVIELLDDLSGMARMMGAVNTIVARNGRLIGDNTDGVGFMTALQVSHADPRHACVAILGAGGAARAVAFALAAAGAREITLINRTPRHAAELADQLYAQFPHLRLAVNRLDAVTESSILINATPVGMWPNVADSPLPTGQRISPQTIVVDLVYNPLETRFLREAKQMGGHPINGLGMLVHQGAAALRLWTGQEAPVKVMFDAARKAIMEKQIT